MVDVHELAREVASELEERLGVQSGTRPLFTVKTLAEHLDVSERTVRAMLAQGVIPSFTVGEMGRETGRRIRPEAVDAYLVGREAS